MPRGGARPGAGRKRLKIKVPQQETPCERCVEDPQSNGPAGYCCARAYARAHAAAVRADKLQRGVQLRLVRSSSEAISTGWDGAARELIAAADLMRRGYVVFRALTAHAPFDLVIWRDGVLERVEVKSKVGVNDRTRFDVLAVVIGNEVSYYRPEQEGQAHV